MEAKIKAPRHLSAEARRMFESLCAEYSILDTAGLRILRTTMEAWDRCQNARRQIDQDGMCIKDKFGQLKPHPLLAVERDSRAAFLAGLKALNLDLEPLQGVGRPHGSGKGPAQVQEELWN